ncbi:double zinc ribbon domain-containing protein [Curtobacterium pusillum]|uniref:double zinc ribbon domain-containing protein n=1 Tax=Curtobacterium pusillum TaxID=69373 RepID=UPI0011A20779
MCPWCFGEFDDEARYCPRCRHTLMYLPSDWRSTGEPMEIERCPTCEAAFTRDDSECSECGRPFRIGRGSVSYT